MKDKQIHSKSKDNKVNETLLKKMLIKKYFIYIIIILLSTIAITIIYYSNILPHINSKNKEIKQQIMQNVEQEIKFDTSVNNNTNNKIDIEKSKKINEKSYDEILVDVDEIYSQMHNNMLTNTGDPQFKKYVEEILEPICPFYEPTGYDYRACLGTLANEAENNFKGDDIKKQLIKDYCQEISDVYNPGIGAIDLNLSCLIYKFNN